MKKYYLIFSAFALVLLIGGGCTFWCPETEEKTDVVIPDGMETEEMEEFTGINLTGEVLGNGEVKLVWAVGDELKETAEKYGLTWGEEENPDYPGRYWFWRGSDHFEKIWSGFPTGTAHFRVCVLKNEECMEYSNDVEVEIE